jgi:hypothetical protein
VTDLSETRRQLNDELGDAALNRNGREKDNDGEILVYYFSALVHFSIDQVSQFSLIQSHSGDSSQSIDWPHRLEFSVIRPYIGSRLVVAKLTDTKTV